METVKDFTFLGSQITADGVCSHEIKRFLILGRKVITNLHSILKSRDITLPTKVCLVKAMVFPVIKYGCKSWTLKKAVAAAAKSLQSCPTLCNPIDSSPPGSPIPGIQGKNTEVGCHFLVQCMKVKSEYLIYVNNYVHLCTFELIENSIFCSQDEIRLFKIILGTQAQQQV